MCSVNDVEDGQNNMEERWRPSANLKMCMKCGENSVVLVRARDPMCKDCFIHYFTHKFRATLGKSKAIRQGEKVLIAFSGGLSSCALLHLINEGLSENAHKKLRFIPEVVFINESTVLGWNDDKEFSVFNDVTSFSEKLGFDIKIIPLEQIFIDSEHSSCTKHEIGETESFNGAGKFNHSCPTSTNVNSCEASSAKDRLRSSFLCVKSLTAKQDLLHSLRSRLLRSYARERQCSKIIVAETSTRLSIKLLLNIAQGRGGSLPFDIGVNDSRDVQVGVIRPMRELTAKEVAFYNRLNGIEPIVAESLDTMVANNASLQKQTEAFVTNLQAGFPSTVSTIFRTGDKLTVSDDLQSTDGRCVLCETPIVDNYVPNAFAAQDSKADAAVNCCGKGDGSCQTVSSTKPKFGNTDLIKRLCYGCRLTFKDMGDNAKALPPYAINELERTIRRSQMKESIQEFLLD